MLNVTDNENKLIKSLHCRECVVYLYRQRERYGNQSKLGDCKCYVADKNFDVRITGQRYLTYCADNCTNGSVLYLIITIINMKSYIYAKYTKLYKILKQHGKHNWNNN